MLHGFRLTALRLGASVHLTSPKPKSELSESAVRMCSICAYMGLDACVDLYCFDITVHTYLYICAFVHQRYGIYIYIYIHVKVSTHTHTMSSKCSFASLLYTSPFWLSASKMSAAVAQRSVALNLKL